MIQANGHIAAMTPYALADLSATIGKPLISLAQNESALAASAHALAAAREALCTGALYPDPDWFALRSAIAEVHGIEAEQILCGAGSMELIACLLRCFAGPERHVLASQYAYAFFRSASLAVAAPYRWAAEHNYTVSVDALLSAVDAHTQVVCIANPANPTGTRISRSELLRLRAGLADDILLIIDEAYGEFSDYLGESMFDLAALGNTVVLRTFSKAYALASMRVGWGLFPPQIALEVRKLLNPNNISAVSQAAATAAMYDQAHQKNLCTQISRWREQFGQQMRQLQIEVPDSYGNFVLLAFADQNSAVQAQNVLRAEGILLRSVASYGLSHCLRATIGTEQQMQQLSEILTTWSETSSSKTRCPNN